MLVRQLCNGGAGREPVDVPKIIMGPRRGRSFSSFADGQPPTIAIRTTTRVRPTSPRTASTRMQRRSRLCRRLPTLSGSALGDWIDMAQAMDLCRQTTRRRKEEATWRRVGEVCRAASTRTCTHQVGDGSARLHRSQFVLIRSGFAAASCPSWRGRRDRASTWGLSRPAARSERSWLRQRARLQLRGG